MSYHPCTPSSPTPPSGATPQVRLAAISGSDIAHPQSLSPAFQIHPTKSDNRPPRLCESIPTTDNFNFRPPPSPQTLSPSHRQQSTFIPQRTISSPTQPLPSVHPPMASTATTTSTASSSTPLRQPWRAHWPPTASQRQQHFTGLGFKKDQKIVMDGTSVFPSTATADNEKAPVLAVAN